MSARIFEGLSWFRARYGPKEAHNEGSVSYAALIVSSKFDLPKAATYLYGRIATDDHGNHTVFVTLNPASIPNEDAAKILIAAHDQCEGNDAGEMSAAPPIQLEEWLTTLFTSEHARELARMLNTVAYMGDDGANHATSA